MRFAEAPRGRTNPTRDVISRLMSAERKSALRVWDRLDEEIEGADPKTEWYSVKMKYDQLKYSLSSAHGDMRGIAEKLLSMLNQETYRISRCDDLLNKAGSLPETYRKPFFNALSRVVFKTRKVLDALSSEFGVNVGEGVVDDVRASARTKLRQFLSRLSIYFGEQDSALNDLEQVFLNSHLD